MGHVVTDLYYFSTLGGGRDLHFVNQKGRGTKNIVVQLFGRAFDMKTFFVTALFGAAALAAPASASTVVATNCVSVADSAGCLFSGNINGNPSVGNVNSYKNAEAAYNVFNNSHPTANPDITLTLLGDTDTAFPGTWTGAGTSSGTWALAGYLVNFVAVKAANNFVLYQITPASSGTWDTLDIPFQRNPPAVSHLMFFGSKAGGVPEPAAWAMMLAGFGLVGSAMRRRTPALATVAA